MLRIEVEDKMIADICMRIGAGTGTGATGAVAAVGTTPVKWWRDEEKKDYEYA